MDKVLRVLVVDDSAYIRKVLSQMLLRSPFIEVVGTARDAEEALSKTAELEPDVVTLDLIMPGIGGIGYIEQQMQRRPVPVVIVSIAGETSDLVLKALDAGAIDFVQKPSALASEKVLDVTDELIEKVKAASTVSMKRVNAPAPARSVISPPKDRRSDIAVILIGISTGGPQALKRIIPRLPKNFPVPIAIVLHMPVGYTEMYAQKLDEVSEVEVREAREGDVLRAGVVLIAPAGRHLTFNHVSKQTVVAHLDARPLDMLHRPSVDVMFQSGAEVFRAGVLGIVMTGMGSDGRDGAAAIKAKGGLIFTEAEESCVVYGMPRAVVEAKLSDKAAPLDEMMDAILEVL
jgi:two-component system, chemotaxis family, protein-glutamate methylesterase/glutaminase